MGWVKLLERGVGTAVLDWQLRPEGKHFAGVVPVFGRLADGELITIAWVVDPGKKAGGGTGAVSNEPNPVTRAHAEMIASAPGMLWLVAAMLDQLETYLPKVGPWPGELGSMWGRAVSVITRSIPSLLAENPEAPKPWRPPQSEGDTPHG